MFARCAIAQFSLILHNLEVSYFCFEKANDFLAPEDDQNQNALILDNDDDDIF